MEYTYIVYFKITKEGRHLDVVNIWPQQMPVWLSALHAGITYTYTYEQGEKGRQRQRVILYLVSFLVS